MKQDTDNLAIALAVAGLDDNIIVSKIEFNDSNKTIFTIKSNDKAYSFDYTIDPENCQNSEEILKNVLALAHKDLGRGKIPFKMLESENQQVDATCRIINAKKKSLLDTLDRYLAISDSSKRNSSPERKVLNDYLQSMEDYTTSMYYESLCFYDTKQYTITEIMYSLLSTISGEEMSLDKDILSQKLNSDQVFAEIYKTHNKVKKDEYDYYNLNYNLSKLKLGKQLTMDEDLYLLTKYLNLGLIKGVDVKTNLKDIFGFNPLDYLNMGEYQDVEDLDELGENNIDDISGINNLEISENDINAIEAEAVGILYSNGNPKKDDLLRIDISTQGLNLIEHIKLKKKLDELKSKYVDDPNIIIVDDKPNTNDNQQGPFGEILNKSFGTFAEMLDKFFENNNHEKTTSKDINTPPNTHTPNSNQNPNKKPTNNPKPTGFDSCNDKDDGLQDNGGKEKERDDDDMKR